MSKAWKNLESTVATKLSGIRISRSFDYGASLPDVIADGNVLGYPNTVIQVECKHSIRQPFVTLLKPVLATRSLVKIKDYLFWDLDKTKTAIHNKKPKVLDKAIPKYLNDYYQQALGYTVEPLMVFSWAKELITPDKSLFRMVVLAKKSHSLRVAYTTVTELDSLVNSIQQSQ